MVNKGTIQGNGEQAIPLVIGKDTVYLHTDIVQVTEDSQGQPVENLYQYNEVQYDKDEYIKLMSERNDTLETQLTETQLALCDVYELIGG